MVTKARPVIDLMDLLVCLSVCLFTEIRSQAAAQAALKLRAPALLSACRACLKLTMLENTPIL